MLHAASMQEGLSHSTMPEAHFTTIGAPSDVYDEVLSWMCDRATHGYVELRRLDALVAMTSFDSQLLRDALGCIEVDEADIVDCICEYVVAKKNRAYERVAACMKLLINERASPFCLQRSNVFGGRMGMPPPTVTYDSVQPSTRSADPLQLRSRATTRALQLIKQYQLWIFDSAKDAVRYLEWKFTVLDICDISDDNPAVRLELILNCLSPQTCCDVLSNAEVGAHMKNESDQAFAIIRYLDSVYSNLRSIRFLDSAYQGCRMSDGESLPMFLSRFSRISRVYERAHEIKLADHDKIVAFGNGLPNRYKIIVTLVENTIATTDFSEYAQRIIQLCDAASPGPTPPAGKAFVNVAQTDLPRKRSRTDDGNPTRQKGNPMSCFRCCETSHTAATCPAKAPKDVQNRCSRCGSRRHQLSTCSRVPDQPCRRCGDQGKSHFESVCPSPSPAVPLNKPTRTTAPATISPAPASANVALVEEFKGMQDLLANAVSIIDCGACTSVDVFDTEPPMLTVRVGSTELSGLIDTGASASFIDAQLVLKLNAERAILKHQVKQLNPPVRIRFGNGGTISDSEGMLRAYQWRGGFFGGNQIPVVAAALHSIQTGAG